MNEPKKDIDIFSEFIIEICSLNMDLRIERDEFDKEFHELYFDALDIVELIMEVEKFYAIRIPDDICEKFESISHIGFFLARNKIIKP